MEWTWNPFRSPEQNFGPPASSALSLPKQPTKLNDYVYELCKPKGRPSVEVVFFHGLQLSGSKEAFLTTWLSRDEEAMELWPSWIARSFPEARILLISYDGFARKEDDQGITDFYTTGENLVQSLTEEAAQVGRDGCPVIMVGHCLGGLVMKELLLRADSTVSLHERDNSKEYVQCLLESMKGLFYYATPHHGCKLADIKTDHPEGNLVKRVETLNKEAARCNEEFRHLRQKYNWKADGIAESLPVTWGKFKSQVLVEEASSRFDVDTLYTVMADHFDACRPKSETDSSYSQLINAIDRALKEDVHGHKMSISDKVVGLDAQVETVKETLKRAQRLGIVGTGGMGKSTLAKAVYNSISGEFEYTCFLSNVKDSIKKTDTVEVLKEHILGNLYYRGRKKTMAWSRLTGKKILFILDDLISCKMMDSFSLGVFSHESCVLITSRDSKFVRSQGFEEHRAKLLDDEASNKLFCLHAFKQSDAPDVYKTRVALFIKKCGGLPLALEVTGKYLSTEREESVWDGAYNRLSNAKPLDGNKEDELWCLYQVIYESLGEDEKEMFLDIATCFHGEELETVKRAWRACSSTGSSADNAWQNLLDKGLVTITPFSERNYHDTWKEGIWTEDGCIQMHEVLRDLGCSINCKTDHKSTRISYNVEDRLPTWPFEQGKPNFKVRILKIVFIRSPVYPRPKINVETLSGLEKLEILWLDGVSLSGEWNLFPVSLEFLRLGQCSWSDKYRGWLPVHREFLKLRRWWGDKDRISLKGSSARRKPSPQTSRNHLRLRHFEIEGFEDMQKLVDTIGLDIRGRLQALERLVFDSGVPEARLQTLSDTFEQLRHIRIDDYTIIILRCSGLAAPTKYLSISGCRIPAVPDTLGQLRCLRHLVISRCPVLVSLPATLENIGALEHLEISYCERLQSLRYSIANLRALRHFVISNCPCLDDLPRNFGQLPALEHLEISHCDRVGFLPLGHLPGLKHFIISNCPALIFLPHDFGERPALEHLEISYCEKLLRLPYSIADLRALRHFVISNCPCLDDIPENFGQLPALEHLEISACDSLQALPQSWLLPCLRHFVVSSCPQLDGLSETFGELPALEHLEISACNRLQALPQSFRLLRCLRHFIISCCPQLGGLPETFGQLPALEHLEISRCDHLRFLPKSFELLYGLGHFVISNCRGLYRLPDNLGELPALEHLEISDCGIVPAPPNSRLLLGRSPCNSCGDSGHIPLTRLQSHLLILPNKWRLKTKLEDPPEDSDDGSDDPEDSPGSSDGGHEEDEN